MAVLGDLSSYVRRIGSEDDSILCLNYTLIPIGQCLMDIAGRIEHTIHAWAFEHGCPESLHMADASDSRRGDAQESDGEPACRTGDPPPARRKRAFKARKGPGEQISRSTEYRRRKEAPRIHVSQFMNRLQIGGNYSEKEIAKLSADAEAMMTNAVTVQVLRPKLRTKCYARAQQHRLQRPLDAMSHEWMLNLKNSNVSYRNYECVVKLSNESFGRNRCNVSVKDIKKGKESIQKTLRRN